MDQTHPINTSSHTDNTQHQYIVNTRSHTPSHLPLSLPPLHPFVPLSFPSLSHPPPLTPSPPPPLVPHPPPPLPHPLHPSSLPPPLSFPQASEALGGASSHRRHLRLLDDAICASKGDNQSRHHHNNNNNNNHHNLDNNNSSNHQHHHHHDHYHLNRSDPWQLNLNEDGDDRSELMIGEMPRLVGVLMSNYNPLTFISLPPPPLCDAMSSSLGAYPYIATTQLLPNPLPPLILSYL